jgi:hypothetical protein
VPATTTPVVIVFSCTFNEALKGKIGEQNSVQSTFVTRVLLQCSKQLSVSLETAELFYLKKLFILFKNLMLPNNKGKINSIDYKNIDSKH